MINNINKNSVIARGKSPGMTLFYASQKSLALNYG